MTEIAELELAARTAERALLEQGFDGERLLKLARAVARDYCARKGAVLGDRFEDLCSALMEAGLKAALRYDPSRSGAGYSFASYLWDKMELAVEPDFFRRKREGFGDRRYGNDGKVVVNSELATEDVDADLDFAKLVSDRRFSMWQQAATTTNLDVAEWIVISLDRAAKQVLRSAA